MMMTGGTLVTLKGTFTFSINQFGLDFNNKEERQAAIDDFWSEYEIFMKIIDNTESNYLRLEFDADKDLTVEEGEGD